jgi:leucyl aminopeptidase (aminopeptidase T)
MRHLRRGIVFLGVVAVMADARGQGSPPPDWQAIARTIVSRMALQKGERVLLVGVPGVADDLVAPLRAAVVSAGGVDLGAVAGAGDTPAGWTTDFAAGAAGKSVEQLTEYFRDVEVAVMLPGAVATQAPYVAMQRVLGSPNARTARTIHFHWAGAYAPTGEALEMTPAFARVYQRAVLNTDYSRLSAAQRAFEQAMRRRRVRVTTPAGTDLRFSIGERPVTKQDGDASAGRALGARNLIDREVELPAGAIRVAPTEESVEGAIVFPDGSWGGERVSGLVMRFARGKVTSFDARSGRSGVEKELAGAGEAGRSFREFALGFNQLLAIPADNRNWIPYYGYGAGVVRLSLGDNTELGGAVGGGYVRWNFFVDATVRVGDEVWVRDGRMVR